MIIIDNYLFICLYLQQLLKTLSMASIVSDPTLSNSGPIQFGFMYKFEDYYRTTMYCEVNQQIIRKAIIYGSRSVDIRHTIQYGVRTGDDVLHTIELINKRVSCETFNGIKIYYLIETR